MRAMWLRNICILLCACTVNARAAAKTTKLIAVPDLHEEGAAYIKTSSGLVRGNALPGGTDEFLGMPYATAERFAAPHDWDAPYEKTPFDGTYYGAPCLQVLTKNTTYGAEACQVMNVWRPRAHSAARDAPLPVLVYIYGGSNDFGEAEPYNSSQLAVNQDVVVASFNYRVGPLGFLAFEEEVAAGRSSGNYALQDMLSALRWVQREIPRFGGDPTKVSIFGQSSGAENVQLVALAVPSSRGLLHGAISQSGGLGARPLASAYRLTAQLAHTLNCTRHGYTSSLECLRAADGNDIIWGQGSGYGAVADGILIPEDPEAMLRKGTINDVNLILGANTNDSNLEVSGEYAGKRVSAKEYEETVQAMLPPAPGNSTLLQEALALYPPLRGRKANNAGNIGWVRSDQTLCSLRAQARAIAGLPHRRGVTFVYRYNYWFQSNEVCTAIANYHPPELGSMHQDELSFVFGQVIFMDIGYTNCSQPGWPGYSPTCRDCRFNAKEANFTRSIGHFWSNFASSGDPNVRGAAAAGSPIWPPYTVPGDENIVLEPSTAPYTPRTMMSESAIGRQRACDFWASI